MSTFLNHVPVGKMFQDHKGRIRKGFCWSKRRISMAIDSIRKVPFGIRQEHRVQLELADAVAAQILVAEPGNTFYAFDSNIFSSFVAAQYNRLLCGAEKSLTISDYPNSSYLYFMFLSLLKNVNSSHLKRDGALWKVKQNHAI